MLEYITLTIFILIITYVCYRTMGNNNDSQGTLPGSKKKAVFITGCDTGFGYSLILHNLKRCDITNVQVWIAGCYYPGGSSAGNIRNRNVAYESVRKKKYNTILPRYFLY